MNHVVVLMPFLRLNEAYDCQSEMYNSSGTGLHQRSAFLRCSCDDRRLQPVVRHKMPPYCRHLTSIDA